jgi:hypothetical protein
MKKINICLGMGLILSLLCVGADRDSVQPRPALHRTGAIETDTDWSILPRADVYEVGASKLGVSSVRNLPDSGFRKLRPEEAIGYTGEYYHCPPGKTPFLVRVIYCKTGLGGFRAERNGGSLAIVNFGRLPIFNSHPEEYERSAVVVNLDFTPSEIYTEISGWR